MATTNKIEKIERLTKEIEGEKDFARVLAKFTEAAGLVKDALGEQNERRGMVLEIVREIDEIIEREMTMDE